MPDKDPKTEEERLGALGRVMPASSWVEIMARLGTLPPLCGSAAISCDFRTETCSSYLTLDKFFLFIINFFFLANDRSFLFLGTSVFVSFFSSRY